MKIAIFLLAVLCVSIHAQSCESMTGGQSGPTLDIVLDSVTANLGRNNLVQYFNGVKPPGSFAYTNNLTALTNLKVSLRKFFQAALLCNDSTVLPYTGPTDMLAVHSAMQISRDDYLAFNNIIYEVLRNLSVSLANINFVRGRVNTVYNGICRGPGCQPPTFCDKYSSILALSNVALVGTVVDGTVANVTAQSNPLLRRFFDGSIPGIPNYTAGGAALALLRDHLITFFGQLSVLGCTDGSIGPYTGRTMRASHAALPIGLQAFNSFNAAVAGVAAGAGVQPADLQAVGALLESLKPDICNQPDCNPTPPPPASASTISFLAPVAAALAAFAYLF